MTIREKIADDDLEGALLDIETILASTTKKNLKNEVVIHRSRLGRNKRDLRLNKISNRKHNQNSSIIAAAILGLLSDMERLGIPTELPGSHDNDEASPSESPIKLLFLSANPVGVAELKIPAELKVIKELLETAIELEQIEVKDQLSTTFEEFRNLITKVQPDVVHFSGHGSARQEAVLFEDSEGYEAPIKAEKLSRFFKHCSPKVSCLILNACDTELIGEQIAPYVKYVIAMKAKFENKAAKAFSKGFYFSLAENKEIGVAFQNGIDTIFHEDWPDEKVPVLFIDGKGISGK